MEIIDILDDDYLLRRIPINNPDFIKPDGTICSYAFQPREKNLNEISVNIKKLTTFNDSIMDTSRFCLAQIETGIVRKNNFECKHNPEHGNYSHASISGEFTKSRCRNLARNAIIIGETEY